MLGDGSGCTYVFEVVIVDYRALVGTVEGLSAVFAGVAFDHLSVGSVSLICFRSEARVRHIAAR